MTNAEKIRDLGLKINAICNKAADIRAEHGLSPKFTLTYYIEKAVKNGLEGTDYWHDLMTLDDFAEERYGIQQHLKQLKKNKAGFDFNAEFRQAVYRRFGETVYKEINNEVHELHGNYNEV